MAQYWVRVLEGGRLGRVATISQLDSYYQTNLNEIFFKNDDAVMAIGIVELAHLCAGPHFLP